VLIALAVLSVVCCDELLKLDIDEMPHVVTATDGDDDDPGCTVRYYRKSEMISTTDPSFAGLKNQIGEMLYVDPEDMMWKLADTDGQVVGRLSTTAGDALDCPKAKDKVELLNAKTNQFVRKGRSSVKYVDNVCTVRIVFNFELEATGDVSDDGYPVFGGDFDNNLVLYHKMSDWYVGHQMDSGEIVDTGYLVPERDVFAKHCPASRSTLLLSHNDAFYREGRVMAHETDEDDDI